LAVIVLLAVVAAACLGNDAGDDITTEPVGADLTRCPDPLVIQTDWFPEAEHGSAHQWA